MPDNEYDKIRKRECEGCAKGLRISEGFLRSGKTLHVVSELGRCEPCTAPSRDAVIDRQAEEIRGLREDFLELLKAAERIKHWHDTHNNGMIVSAESVRDLWAATEDARAALNPTPKEHLNA